MQNNVSFVDILLRLVKYKLSLTVTFSAVTGYLLTGNTDIYTFAIVFSGVLLLSSGSSALNQVQERKTDPLMERTKDRPLPSGEISLANAVTISVVSIAAGLLLLLIKGWFPTLLALATVILYNFIYTPLKRLTALSILPGAFVGALCPLIGWTCSETNVFHPLALFISIFVFLWQVPHFYLLILQYSSDYKKAGFPEIIDHIGASGIKVLVFCWIVLTSVFLFSFPFFHNIIRPTLILPLILLNLTFIFLFYRLLFDKTSDKPVRQAFILINSFAVVIFLILIIGKI